MDPQEHKEFIQPTEMAYARWKNGNISSRHSRQSSVKVGNDQQPRWALDLLVFSSLSCALQMIFL